MSLTITAFSSLAGSISIASWIVVFTPQIIENARRRSADGLSVAFLLIWLVGDIFNILGAVLQGVLPTMLALAVYYTLADVVLLAQVGWYRLRKRRVDGDVEIVHENGEEAVMPLLEESKSRERDRTGGKVKSTAYTVVFNSSAILLVCAAGVFGWWATSQSTTSPSDSLRGQLPHFNPLGQIFGYLCAALYLGSRVPQLLLNYRRKSTDGISLLFFLFACLGNLSYDVSIFAFDPSARCQGGPQHCVPGEMSRIYWRYIAVNTSWIIGSLGTLVLDMGVFVQFFLYRDKERDERNGDEERRIDGYGSLA